MCQCPFDYCGPVAETDGLPNCDFGARRGSAFHPMDGDLGESAAAEPTLAEPTPAYDAGPSEELPIPDEALPVPGANKKPSAGTFMR